jgi:hypothetical protein
MYHADDQNGDLVTREMAERASCIGNPPCYSSPGSAESHFADNFPPGTAIDGMAEGKLADAEDASRGPYNENLDSVSASASYRCEPSGVQARARNTRSLTQFEGVGEGEQLQSWEEIQKGRLPMLEELADILACIFAEAPPTGRSGCSS